MIDDKIMGFRKSKEEMIKIIIRRVQRHYKAQHQCKRDERFIKYGGFKSMNTVYLETMFSDSLFVEAFEEVAMNFRSEFEEENEKKVEMMCELVRNEKVRSDKGLFIQILSEKNKMPWPRTWISKMMKNIHWMYINFSRESRRDEVIEMLEK